MERREGWLSLDYSSEDGLIANQRIWVRDYKSRTAGFKGAIDMFTFNYVADQRGSTEDNSAILETEIRIREGIKMFSVEGNVWHAIANYMDARNKHFGSQVHGTVVYTDVDVYTRSDDGNWVKKTEKRTFIKLQ